MVAQAASAADDEVREDEPGPARRYVEALAGLPGVEHVAVVDVSGQRVLAEWGGPAGSADAVLDRARRATDPAHRGRRELEDTVSTTASAFHLSRLVLPGAGQPESVWVALRVDRERGSLAWSRAALAGLGGAPGTAFAVPSSPVRGGAPVPEVPDAESHGEAVPIAAAAPPAPAAPAPAAPALAAPHAPAAPAVLPPPRAVPDPPRPAGPAGPPPVPAAAGPAAPAASAGDVVPRARTASKARVALTARAAPPLPEGPVAPEPGPDTAEVAVAGAAATVELVLPAPFVPAARPSPETDPEPPAPVAERRSSFAPVMVVLPPPSPVPDDGTTEEPAPMPAPIIIAPDPAADMPAPAGGPAPEPTDEPAVVRRLIHGLRRRS